MDSGIVLLLIVFAANFVLNASGEIESSFQILKLWRAMLRQDMTDNGSGTNGRAQFSSILL